MRGYKIMIPFFKKNPPFLLFSAIFLLSNTLAYAETTSESAMSSEEALAAAQNPLSPTYSLPLKYSYHGGANRGGVSTFSLQPIFPIALGQDWNLINQLNLNFIDTPGGVTGLYGLPNPYVKDPTVGFKGATGLADLNFTSLLSPITDGNFFWGVGTTITMPSDAPSRELGSGKFSMGPALGLFMQTESWTVGLQGNQIWSIVGSAGRKSVSQMQLKPAVNYNLSDNWYLFSNTEIIGNWTANSNQKWTVPIGAGVGKLFTIGGYKINTRVESYYNIVRPDEAPDWSVGTTIQLMFPK